LSTSKLLKEEET